MKTYFLDSFTDEKFKGNPAAVCLTNSSLSETLMQSIAKEIGFSETAFIRELSNDIYAIRFFSPQMEIPLCGHATLAASKIIFDTTGLSEFSFLNIQNVELKIRTKDGSIIMEFPINEAFPFDVPSPVLEALGIDEVIESRFSPHNKIILLQIEGSERLAALQPDFPALKKSYSGINGVLVTTKSDSNEHDFEYRYFWPWAGTNEDPVTGGVQTFLTPFWAALLGKKVLRAYQSSERTGKMTTELLGDKVLIYGEAVLLFEGEFKGLND